MINDEKLKEQIDLLKEIEELNDSIDAERSLARQSAIDAVKEAGSLEFSLTERELELVESGAETFAGILDDRGVRVTACGDSVDAGNLNGNIEKLEYDSDFDDVVVSIAITDADDYGKTKEVSINRVLNPENVLKFIVSLVK